MMFARESVPLVAPVAALGLLALVMSAVLSPPGWRVAGVTLLALAFLVLLFFRDPERTIPRDPQVIVSPADGKVISVEQLPDGRNHIAIFLSVFDVHINRVPCGGTIDSVTYIPGTYVHAGTPGAEGNAQCVVTATTRHGALSWRQVSGWVARKISCRIKAGATVQTGDRFGLIYFGSRMDVYYPSSATALVKPGDRVQGGSSVIAKFNS
jgi:phosphatidylserine decarboxylase